MTFLPGHSTCKIHLLKRTIQGRGGQNKRKNSFIVHSFVHSLSMFSEHPLRARH